MVGYRDSESRVFGVGSEGLGQGRAGCGCRDLEFLDSTIFFKA